MNEAKTDGATPERSGPSYHDLYITTAEIERTSIFNLPYGFSVECRRTTGWVLHDSGVRMSPHLPMQGPKILAGEYEEPEKWLVLDVDGHVIVDSRGREGTLMAQTTSAGLSKLLWEARELVEMYADIVESRTQAPADWPRRVVQGIDDYRAERGWNPHGFGGEDSKTSNVIRLEFEFHADSRDADLTRLSDALAALEAMGVIVRKTQLGFRAPYPEESDRGSNGAS